MTRVAFADFWSRFEPAHFLRRFPAFAEVVRPVLVSDPRAADLVVFSCFAEGRKLARARDPREWAGTRAIRLFYTGENVRPDLTRCEFAMSFCREIVDARHLRVPNYVGNHVLHGFPSDALATPPADPGALRRSKTRFCAYVQRNRVPLREEFVKQLSRYQRVDCGGPSLNNLDMGTFAERGRKYGLYKECKFAVTFENEAAVGYTTEKLPDALVAGCVPIYWGDPTVDLDFDPGCFLHRRDFASDEALIARIVELDRDDAAYEAMLGGRRAPRVKLEDGTDPLLLRRFFDRIADAVAHAGGRAELREPAPFALETP